MNRTEFEALSDTHKKYESMNQQYFMDELPIMVRLDGRGFSKFTKDMEKPFDANFAECMKSAAVECLKECNALVAYTGSDEITLIIPPFSNYFGGRKSKIETILASTATAAFIVRLAELMPKKVIGLPKFDARAWQYPNEELCVESLLWRETDCTRNSLSMVCQKYFTQKQLEGAGTARQHDLLHKIGVNWATFEDHYKRGTYFAKRSKEFELEKEVWDKIPEKKRPESNKFMRRVVTELCLPPVEKVANLHGVIFFEDDPLTMNELMNR